MAGPLCHLLNYKLALLATVVGVVAGQRHAVAAISHLWSFDELAVKADEVIIAEHLATTDTGRRTPSTGQLRLAELSSELRVLVVLKPCGQGPLRPSEHFKLRHFRPDWQAWERDHPPSPGAPPPGLMAGVSVLDFRSERGPYLLFVKRLSSGLYEPVSVQSPADSVLLLRDVRCRNCPSPTYEQPPDN